MLCASEGVARARAASAATAVDLRDMGSLLSGLVFGKAKGQAGRGGARASIAVRVGSAAWRASAKGFRAVVPAACGAGSGSRGAVAWRASRQSGQTCGGATG